MPVALTAAAAFPELWPAIAIALVIWAAFYIFLKPISQLLGALPIVGGAVAGAVWSGVTGLTSWAMSWADGVIVPLLEMVAAPIAVLADTLGQLVAFAESAAAQLAALADSVWASVASLENEASTALSRGAAALAAAAGAAASAAAALAGLEVLRSSTIPAARDQAISAAAQHAQALAAAEASARVGSDDAINARARSEAAARAAADAALESWRTGVVVPELGRLTGEVGQLTTAVGTLTAAQLITRLSTLEAEVSTTFRDCVTPQCNVIGPTLGNLAGLADLGMVLALGAFVGEAARDPETVARDVAGAIGGIHDVASGLLGAFTGIRA